MKFYQLLKKICLPVVGETVKEFLKNLDESQKIAHLVELRVDHVKKIIPDDLEMIKKNLTKKAIFTCRRKEEGGKFLASESERLAIIRKALELKFDFLDIEFSTLREEKIKLSCDQKNKIIVSYHNFSTTPFEWELRNLIFYMKKYGEIVKIATMVKEDNDNIKLFRLMVNKKFEEQRIIIGMGEKGKITRILGPIFGNCWTYSAGLEGEVAPGQLSFFELVRIYEQIIN